MVETASDTLIPETQVTVEEVKRILEVGRLLLSVLTPEELEELKSLGGLFLSNSIPVDQSSSSEIGNTGVT
jgi:hypothetical protein